MKIEKKSLLEAMKVATKATGKLDNFPVLQCVLLDGPHQRIVATDLEMAVLAPLEISDFKRTIPAETLEDDLLEGLTGPQLKNLAEDYGIDLPAGKPKVAEIRENIMTACRESAGSEEKSWGEKFCLPAKEFMKILTTLEEDVVEITLAEGSQETLFTRTPYVRIGENFHDLATFAVDEFPDITADLEGLTFPTSVTVTRKDLEAVSVAAPVKDAGFMTQQVYFDLSEPENPRMVATDGHRLHWTIIPNEKAHVPENAKSFGLPLDCLKVIKAAFGTNDEVQVAYSEEKGRVLISFGEDGGLYVRNPEGRFPDWKAVIPNNEKSVSVAKEDLEKPLKQALTLSNQRYAGLKVRFNGGVDVEFTNPERGAYQKISIPIKAKTYGKDEDTVLGLNGDYLLAAMAHIESEDLAISFGDASKPVCMAHEGFNALVMPMRV